MMKTTPLHKAGGTPRCCPPGTWDPPDEPLGQRPYIKAHPGTSCSRGGCVSGTGGLGPGPRPRTGTWGWATGWLAGKAGAAGLFPRLGWCRKGFLPARCPSCPLDATAALSFPGSGSSAERAAPFGSCSRLGPGTASALPSLVGFCWLRRPSCVGVLFHE